MEITSLNQPSLGDQDIECWDDDEDLQCGDALQLRNFSTTTSVAGSSVRPSGHRDSVSSRRSWRSDRDSNFGDDESWQLLITDKDDSSNEDAIISAKRAGIPIPPGIPNSALLGGTIKKLGGRKPRAALVDDWCEDLDLSAVDDGLEVKLNCETTSPDALLHLSSLSTSSPVNHFDSHPYILHDLVKFRDTEEDSSFGEVPSIKIAKTISDQDTPFLPTQESCDNNEDFESELILPEGDEPLQLSKRQDAPKSPELLGDEFDTEWAEGSIGVRFGGTKREGRSNRSSSIGALSPSISSCLTMESEDEGLDGLVLPDGPLDLQKSLQNQQSLDRSTSDTPTEQQNVTNPSDKNNEESVNNDDFFSGIEIGNGEAFDSGKLTLNRNVKRKVEQPSTPPRRGGTSITFTNKVTTRIPRLSTHERPHSTQLEPVSETGAPVPQFRRPHTRLSGHLVHSSLSNIPLPSSHSMSSSISPPNRRAFGSRSPKDSSKSDLTNTNAQLLKAKRSVPMMRPLSGSTATSQGQRSPPRQEGNNRIVASSRPKTPVEQSSTESRHAIPRRTSVPYLPSGAPESKPTHTSIKHNRPSRRTGSESSGDSYLNPRSSSRMSKLNRFDTHTSAEGNNATSKQAITRLNRRKNIWDGTELDIFDDLPTSASAENKFMKAPIKRGAPRSLRNKLSHPHMSAPPRTDTPVPAGGLMSPSTPRFARDTNASRNAREQRITSINNNQKEREGGPLAPLSTNWKAQAVNRPISSPSMRRHSHKNSSNRPHLIKPMGNGVHDAKSVKGMQYNPTLCKWEGNENYMTGFDALPAPTSLKPSPALISNVGGTSAAQVVNGMLFDPQRMCWVKAATSRPGSKSGPAVAAEDEEDVFAGFEDLEDRPQKSTAALSARSSAGDADVVEPDEKSGGESSDEWPITEEFDVGPEFIRRQRAEEERWKRKVSRWISEDSTKLDHGWRWAIRNLVGERASIDAPPPPSIS